MATVMITGGTGMIGKALSAKLLDLGYDVIILTREKEKKSSREKLLYAFWNPLQEIIDQEALSKTDHIIHLAGAGIADKRWTKARKTEILKSRVDGGLFLAKTLKELPNTVKSFTSASAIGWYGEDKEPPIPFTEEDPPANNFLGQTCKKWEESTDEIKSIGIRLVKLRTGIVLSRRDGVLGEFKKYLKFGLATVPGNGHQIISWIHIDDLVNLYIKSIVDEKMNGVYNAVAPNPVTYDIMVKEFARAENGKKFMAMNIPSFVLKLVLGEMSVEILKSTTVSAEKIINTGFQFQYPEIKEAVNN